MFERIFILGSNSFSGAFFVNHCLNQNSQVVGASRSVEPPHVLRPYVANKNIRNFRFHQLDLNHDFDKITRTIDEFKPELIVDFAGQGMVAPSWENPAQWYQTNIVSKAKLHTWLRNKDFLKRYVRISTPEVYGSTPQRITEDHAYRPSTPYAVSHAATDMSLQALHKQFGFPMILTRSSNFFGPYQQLYRIVPRTVIFARLGKKLPLHGGGTSVRNFVHVEDFCTAVWDVSTKGVLGETYHISTDELFSIREVVDRICFHMDIPVSQVIENAEDRPGKDGAYILDNNKIRTTLGWQPKRDIDVGIKEVIQWVDQSLSEIKKLPLDYIHKP